jgi:hypothetical protein
MTELEIAARDAISWVRKSHNVCDAREEDHLALLVQLSLAGFYYDRALENNDQLRLTGDPEDIIAAVDQDLATIGALNNEGLSARGFLQFKERYPDWKVKLQEIIDKLNAIRPKEVN